MNNLKKSDSRKIQLTKPINFVSSKDDNDEEHVMHTKSGSKEIMINDKADKVIKIIFKLLLSRYQIRIEKSIKGSDFVFDYAPLLHYKCQKISPNLGESYIDSSDWIKNKKPTINNINKKDNK